MNEEERNLYILGPRNRGGNDSQLNSIQTDQLIALRQLENGLRLPQLTEIFNQQEFEYPLLQGFSVLSMSKRLCKIGFTRKEATVVAAQANNPVDQLAWLDGIAFVDLLYIIDVDEISASRNQLKNKWAWAYCGEDFLRDTDSAY